MVQSGLPGAAAHAHSDRAANEGSAADRPAFSEYSVGGGSCGSSPKCGANCKAGKRNRCCPSRFKLWAVCTHRPAQRWKEATKRKVASSASISTPEGGKPLTHPKWRGGKRQTFMSTSQYDDGGWARIQQQKSRSRMNSLMAGWRNYRQPQRDYSQSFLQRRWDEGRRCRQTPTGAKSEQREWVTL